ncbi:MAG: 2-dehydropantoate 2-reductase [Burkholderiales bacterium]|nr:2-dehydropantoate 2-reductase [Burkholderiales bacterium]
MTRAIAIVGTGAIGASVGADLTRAGHDVTLLDQWPAHVEAMRSRGLRVVMSDDDFVAPVRAYHLCDLARIDPAFDIVMLAPKSYDTRWMAQLIAPYLKSDGVVVGLQNGMNDDAIAAIAGCGRTAGCVVELSAEVFTPGVVMRNTTRQATWFGFGEYDGAITPRLREIESLMRCTAKVSLTANIAGAKWTKLVNSSMILSVFGMLGLQSWQATDIPEVFKLCIQVGRETMAVGAALGLTLEPIFGFTAEQMLGSTDETVEKLLRAVLGHLGPNARKARGVVLQDYLRGRRTEVDCLTGVVVAKGQAVNVPTPANAAVAQVNARIRAGELRPHPSNLALVEDMLRGAAPA